MRHFQYQLRLLALCGAALLLGLIAARTSSAAAPSPPHTITARRITARPHTLRKGSLVTHAITGQRVFVDATHGFALADTQQAQYPAVTVDGGRTWRTNGPVLHIAAAMAPLGVIDVGAANRHTFFAFGGGSVADVTSDGGKHWWQAFLGDDVLSVVSFGGRLIAVAQDATGSGATAQTVVYVSRDGGRHWHLNNKLGAF